MRWIAACALLVCSQFVSASELRGKVIHVADGDTITVLDSEKVEHKIRLKGIDAPEKKQAFGTKSKELLTEKVAGHEVVIEWKEKDRYGRILGEVMLGRRHINLEMVQEGMAWLCPVLQVEDTCAGRVGSTTDTPRPVGRSRSRGPLGISEGGEGEITQGLRPA